MSSLNVYQSFLWDKHNAAQRGIDLAAHPGAFCETNRIQVKEGWTQIPPPAAATPRCCRDCNCDQESATMHLWNTNKPSLTLIRCWTALMLTVSVAHWLSTCTVSPFLCGLCYSLPSQSATTVAIESFPHMTVSLLIKVPVILSPCWGESPQTSMTWHSHANICQEATFIHIFTQTWNRIA